MNDEIRRLEMQIEDLKRQLGGARRRAASTPRIDDYPFRSPTGDAVSLYELFGKHDDLWVVHNMGRRCAYCTMWADGFNGVYHHLADRAAFVLCSEDEPAVLREFSAGRGWRFPCVSGRGSAFNAEMGFADPKDGSTWPGVSAFHRNPDGSIVRTGAAQFGPGDNFCAVWHLLDLLKDGAAGWEPRLRYEPAAAAR
jgi:predicted dithiol-disulfide oxidoreductase (DUF899 family)